MTCFFFKIERVICIRTFTDMYMPMAGAGNANGVNMNGANNALRAAGYDMSTVNNNDKNIQN